MKTDTSFQLHPTCPPYLPSKAATAIAAWVGKIPPISRKEIWAEGRRTAGQEALKPENKAFQSFLTGPGRSLPPENARRAAPEAFKYPAIYKDGRQPVLVGYNTK